MNKRKDFGAGPEWFFLAALLAPSALQSSRPLGKKIAQAMVNLGELLQEAIEEQELRELEDDGVELIEEPEVAAKPAPKKVQAEPVKETVIRSAPEPTEAPAAVASPEPVKATTPKAEAPKPVVELKPEPPIIEPPAPVVSAPKSEPVAEAKPEAIAEAKPEPVAEVKPEPVAEIKPEPKEEDAEIRWKSDTGKPAAPAPVTESFQDEFIEEVILSAKPTENSAKPELKLETPAYPAPEIPKVSAPVSLRVSDAPKPSRTLADILQQSAAKAQESEPVPEPAPKLTSEIPLLSPIPVAEQTAPTPVAAAPTPTPAPAVQPVVPTPAVAEQRPAPTTVDAPPVQPIVATAPPVSTAETKPAVAEQAPSPTPVVAPAPVAAETPKPVIEVPVIQPIPAAAMPPAPGTEMPKQVSSVEELLFQGEKPKTQVGEWDFAVERNRARAEGTIQPTEPLVIEQADAEETAVSERRGFAFFPESEETEESSVEAPRPTGRQITKIGFRSRLEAKSRHQSPKPKMAGPRPHATVAPSVPVTAGSGQTPPTASPSVQRNRFTVPEDLEVG